MPRSRYIYVAQSSAGGELMGAFTVKHEMHTFAARNGWYEYPGGVTVTVVGDGRGMPARQEYPLTRPTENE